MNQCISLGLHALADMLSTLMGVSVGKKEFLSETKTCLGEGLPFFKGRGGWIPS